MIVTAPPSGFHALLNWNPIRVPLSLGTGIWFILIAHRRGWYQQGGFPFWYVRVAFTLCGIYWLFDGIARVVWGPQR